MNSSITSFEDSNNSGVKKDMLALILEIVL